MVFGAAVAMFALQRKAPSIIAGTPASRSRYLPAQHPFCEQALYG